MILTCTRCHKLYRRPLLTYLIETVRLIWCKPCWKQIRKEIWDDPAPDKRELLTSVALLYKYPELRK